MKVLNKVLKVAIVGIMFLTLSASVFAVETKTRLDVTQKSATKNLEDDQGTITKTIVDSDTEKGEVTVELKLSNIKNDKEETTTYENTEIYMMVSENIATDDAKLAKTISNIEKLSNEILKTNSKTKIGIIGITGTISKSYTDEDGNVHFDNDDEGTVPGRESDAEIVVELTNNIDNIKNGIKNMNASKNKYHLNLQAAIRLAYKSYSNDTNKILISLYDGVPGIAIGVYSTIKGDDFGKWYSEYKTLEEAVKGRHEKISTYTRNEILKLKNNNISFILLKPEDTSYDRVYYNTITGEKILDFDGSPYVQKLYGTIENPTYGKMYSFDETNIDTIITENMYQDVKNLMQLDMKEIKIEDTFSSEIIKNFDFSYVGTPTIGNASKEIDKDTKSITWEIDKLEGGKTATLKYKLKIKDMKNKELLNKVISVNDKVEITYKDIDAKSHTMTMTESPKIKLTEIKEDDKDKKPTSPSKPNGQDDTTAKKDIPQTGVGYGAIVAIISVLAIGSFTLIKLNKSKDIK